MLAPGGDAYLIESQRYRAAITQGGATLRSLELNGRALVDGFDDSSMPSGGRGQVLAPWPNRIRDGAYEFGGKGYQLPLSEPGRHNASHGLVRWVSWSVLEHTRAQVTLGYRLMAQTGYPWTLDLQVCYALADDGLTITHSAVNRSASPAPYAFGAHPYLTLAAPTIDGCQLRLPASTRLLVDDRKLPTGLVPVAGTDYDFRVAGTVGPLVLDHAFTDLIRGDDGRSTTTLTDPATGESVSLWVDAQHRWLQIYSADDAPATARRSLAVEPMTSPPDAFNSGTDLVMLAASGHDGDRFSASFGIYGSPSA